MGFWDDLGKKAEAAIKEAAEKAEKAIKEAAELAEKEAQRITAEIEAEAKKVVENDPNLKAAAAEMQKFTEKAENDLKVFADAVDVEAKKLGEQIEAGVKDVIENDPNLKAAVEEVQKVTEQATSDITALANEVADGAQKLGEKIEVGVKDAIENDPNLKAAAEEVQKFTEKAENDLKVFAEAVDIEAQKLGEQIEVGVKGVIENDPNLRAAAEEIQKAGAQTENDFKAFADVVDAEAKKLGEQIEAGVKEIIENDPNLKAATEELQKVVKQAASDLEVLTTEVTKGAEEIGKEMEKGFQEFGVKVEDAAKQLEEQLQQAGEEIKKGAEVALEQVTIGGDKLVAEVQKHGQQFVEKVMANETVQAIVEGAQKAERLANLVATAGPVAGNVITLAVKATPGLALHIPEMYDIYQDVNKNEVKTDTLEKVNTLLNALDSTLKKDLPELLKNDKFPELAKQIVALDEVKEPLKKIGLSPEFVSNSVPKVLNFAADLVGPVAEIAKHATSEQSRGQLVGIINNAKSLAAIDDNDKKQKKETILALVDGSLALLAQNEGIQEQLNTEIPRALEAHAGKLGEVLEDFVKQTKIGKSLNININGEKAINLIAKKMPQIVRIATLYSDHKYGAVIKKTIGLILDKDVLKLAANAIFSKSSEEKSPKEKGNPEINSSSTPQANAKEEKLTNTPLEVPSNTKEDGLEQNLASIKKSTNKHVVSKNKDEKETNSPDVGGIQETMTRHKSSSAATTTLSKKKQEELASPVKGLNP